MILIDSIDLAPFATPSLQWDQRITTEQTSSYDRAFLEISGDDGQWATVWERDEVTNGATETIVVDLSAYANQTVSLIFQFDSVEDSANAYEGWILDNVVFQNAQ